MDADGGIDDDGAAIGQVLDAASDAELDDVLEAAARLPDQVFKRRGAYRSVVLPSSGSPVPFSRHVSKICSRSNKAEV